MKYILRLGEKGSFRKDFWYQHRNLDSFTRIRATEFTESPSSQDSSQVQEKMEQRLPFKIACMNTDNGSENGKEFSKKLQKDNIFHFYSRAGTPTDNPRVERSFLSDDLEFYGRGGLCKNFQEQRLALIKQDDIWNWKRPHQALSYLSPMKFYQLWKENPEAAYQIVGKWQNYLKRQRIRQAQSRRIKRKEQIEALMNFINAKLSKTKGLNKAKLQLINCQLCSIA